MQLKHKIVNHLIINGNKKTCENIVLKTFKLIQKQTLKKHKNLIKLGIINTSPVIQIKKQRKKMLEFPYVLSKKNRLSLAIKFIIAASKQNLDIKFYHEFSKVIVLSFQNKSDCIKKKENLQEHAFAKKKYAAYRWF